MRQLQVVEFQRLIFQPRLSLFARRALLNDGHAGDALPVLAQLGLELLQKAPVDIKDDLHVPGQQLFYEADRPLFQRFRQHRVISEGKHL